jgi:hypothetical protein
MRRRTFLKTLPAVAAAIGVPRLRGVRIKITDIRIVKLRVVKEIGKFEGFLGPTDITPVRIGGGSFLEILTDQGLSGIGPAIDPIQLPALKIELMGKDPFDVQTLVGNLREVTGMTTSRRTGAPAGTPVPVGMRLARIRRLKSRSGTSSVRRAISRCTGCGGQRRNAWLLTPVSLAWARPRSARSWPFN